MLTKKIEVYGRIKPASSHFPIKNYKIGEENDGEKLTIEHIKSFPMAQPFRFQKVFDQENHNQEELFNIVAKPVLNKFLMGYNGTIFAYGQTGTGKTYTMMGNFLNYEDRGIIPRSLEYIFKCAGEHTITSISYFEIYNERGYDLITTETEEDPLDFQNVTVLEDSQGNLHFRNLSSHNVKTVEEALDLLILGDGNRMVAETMNNLRSSRSHTIFLILLESYDSENDTSLRSTLHLVDLAGSERLGKEKVGITKSWETRYINLSLHYLEQVLVALGEPGRVHIPYRNSLMTTVLKNSLGGNCCTVMIATISLENKDVAESLQTCRFSQRVSLIKNYNEINKVMDAEKELKMLKKENLMLKAQLSVLKTNKLFDNSADNLLEEEKQECVEKVKNFLEDTQMKMDILDFRKVQYCFKLLKEEINRLRPEIDKKSEYLTNINNHTIEQNKKRAVFFKTPENIFIEREGRSDGAKGPRENILRKRRVMDIPKINVIYKKYKSTESLIRDSKNVKSYPQKRNGHPNPTILSHTAHKSLEISRSKFSQTSLAELSLDTKQKLTSMQSQINMLKEKEDQENSRAKDDDRGEKIKNSRNTSSALTAELPKKFEEGRSDSRNYILCNVCTTNDFNTKDVEVKVNRAEALEENVHESNGNGLHTSEDSENGNKKENSRKLCSYSESHFSESDLPLTGDKEVDEEILKFYKARFEKFKSENVN